MTLPGLSVLRRLVRLVKRYAKPRKNPNDDDNWNDAKPTDDADHDRYQPTKSRESEVE
jgi:hypothetical protein